MSIDPIAPTLSSLRAGGQYSIAFDGGKTSHRWPGPEDYILNARKILLNGSGEIYSLGLLNRFRILLPSPSFFLASDPFGAVSPPGFALPSEACSLTFFNAARQGF